MKNIKVSGLTKKLFVFMVSVVGLVGLLWVMGKETDNGQGDYEEVAQHVNFDEDLNSFKFLNYNFEVEKFKGSGGTRVPKETPYVFQWEQEPSHYLIRQDSPAGRVIRQLLVGDTVELGDETYIVTHIKETVPNDENSKKVLESVESDMTVQTSESTLGVNGHQNLTIWHLTRNK